MKSGRFLALMFILIVSKKKKKTQKTTTECGLTSKLFFKVNLLFETVYLTSLCRPPLQSLHKFHCLKPLLKYFSNIFEIEFSSGKNWILNL